jgi:GNAT superfamily N-acetyltransferase
MDKLLIKKASELTDEEFHEIDRAIQREFHASFNQGAYPTDRMIFLLKDKEDKILSMGQLIPVGPVRFKGKNFSILGVGGTISNIKGKGYGKKIMEAIKCYLRENHKVGVGFCRSQNSLFYKKCGFSVDLSLIKRFVYYKHKKRIVNRTDDCLIYFDEEGSLIKKVMAGKKEEVLLSRPPDW